MKFTVLKKSKKSKARLGLLETSHGVVETPCFVPVATQGTVKALDNEEVLQAKSQILICNTYHLHLRPGGDLIGKNGGLHKFMNWSKPLMTDSGGFQVFSLGFGKDLGIGKILKQKSDIKVTKGQQPKLLKITPNGVFFRSYVDGREIFLGPRESIRIQEKIGADIIFAFDECTPPAADYQYTKNSLLKTHEWAKICLKEKKSKQAIFGIVQGGKYKDLRKESAELISSLDFDGFGIGGEFGDDKKEMTQMISWVTDVLPDGKPRHLLGIGHQEDMLGVIKSGIDTFDCIAPTHYARRGIVFTYSERLDFTRPTLLNDKNPIDKKCSCYVCQNYKRNYLCHLFRANELTALKLFSFHNLYLFNTLVEDIRKDIKKGKI